MDDDLIGAYLSELDTALVVALVPASVRAAIVVEIGDGLVDAVAAHRGRDCPQGEAVSQAIDEFGAAAVVAARFVPVLAAARVHRCGLVFLRTGPLVGAVWLVTAWLAGGLGMGVVASVVVVTAIVVAVVVVAAVPWAVFALMVTGPGSRWWTVAPRQAAAAMQVAASGAIVGDLVLLTALGVAAPAVLTGHIVVAGGAVLASLARIVFATRSAMWLRRVRAALRAV